MYVCIHPSIHPFDNLSIHIYLSTYLFSHPSISICLCIYLSVYLPTCLLQVLFLWRPLSRARLSPLLAAFPSLSHLPLSLLFHLPNKLLARDSFSQGLLPRTLTLRTFSNSLKMPYKVTNSS